MSRRKPWTPRPLDSYTPRGLAGLKGFWVRCNKHYGGDARMMVNCFIASGLTAQDPCPYNGAWTKRGRVSNRLHARWAPPPLHPDILDNPPF